MTRKSWLDVSHAGLLASAHPACRGPRPNELKTSAKTCSAVPALQPMAPATSRPWARCRRRQTRCPVREFYCSMQCHESAPKTALHPWPIIDYGQRTLGGITAEWNRRSARVQGIGHDLGKDRFFDRSRVSVPEIFKEMQQIYASFAHRWFLEIPNWTAGLFLRLCFGFGFVNNRLELLF